MKKGVYLGIFFILIFLLLNVVAEEQDPVKDFKDNLKNNTGKAMNMFEELIFQPLNNFFTKTANTIEDYTGRFFGWRTVDGELKWKTPFPSLKSHFLIGLFGSLIFAGLFKFFNKKYWKTFFYCFFIVFFIPIFFYSLFDGKNYNYLYTSLSLTILTFIFWLINVNYRYMQRMQVFEKRVIKATKYMILDSFFRKKNQNIGDYLELYHVDYLVGNWLRLIIFFFAYPFIMILVPFLNRIISIISTEALGSGWFLVSIVLFMEIVIGPSIITEIANMFSRNKEYKKKMIEETYQKIMEEQIKVYGKKLVGT